MGDPNGSSQLICRISRMFLPRTRGIIVALKDQFNRSSQDRTADPATAKPWPASAWKASRPSWFSRPRRTRPTSAWPSDLWNHRDDLLTFPCQPELHAINWRAELAIRFGVFLRKVWGGSRTRPGAREQAVLMSV
jgi:hypothetical protein